MMPLPPEKEVQAPYFSGSPSLFAGQEWMYTNIRRPVKIFSLQTGYRFCSFLELLGAIAIHECAMGEAPLKSNMEIRIKFMRQYLSCLIIPQVSPGSHALQGHALA
jgi:hypothetical protein